MANPLSGFRLDQGAQLGRDPFFGEERPSHATCDRNDSEYSLNAGVSAREDRAGSNLGEQVH